MSAVVVNEGLIHYEAFGRGKPLVFIHGWLGSWRYWVPTMEELSVNQRTYALDLWGFGDSDKSGYHYTLDAYVKMLGDFLDKLGVFHPTLVGHALGGAVALKFAVEHQDFVDQVMAVNVPLVGEAINRSLVSLSDHDGALSKLASKRAKYPEVEVHRTDARAVVSSIQSLMQDDLRRVLPPLTIPTLLVYGRNDPLIKPLERIWLRGCEGNVRAIFLDDSQHFPMLEEQNKFNRLLIDFIDAGDDVSSLELKEEWQRRLR
ncbi:MAG TPA: alpha/beta hydrolase [Chloroflexi bacterium]|nr:alpha/beta hydrolase [Chloroflexota bacterium]